VRTLGVGSRRVRTGVGLALSAQGVVERAGDFDLVVVPGLNTPLIEEVEEVLARPEAVRAVRWLRRQHRCGAVVAGSCTGAFLLAEAGLLHGAPATTSWFLAEAFRERYPDVELQADRMVTCAGRVLCGGAALAQMDLMLAVVTRFCGPRLADLVARYLVLDRRPTQARYALTSHLAASTPEVSRAETFVRAHLGEPLRVGAIARAVGTSPRTLARRVARATGLSPLRFVQRLRVEQSVHLLETTDAPFDEVARQVGYAEPAALRRVLRRETGQTARSLRARQAPLGLAR